MLLVGLPNKPISCRRAFSSYRGLTVDTDGNLWAELYNVPVDSIPKWMVLDADGRWLGTVTLPKRFSPLDIGPDYILSLWRDADDVEPVQLYDLIKPER